MNPDTEFAIIRAPRHNTRHWTSSSVTWAEMVAWTKNPADKKECGSYVLGTFRPTSCDDHEEQKGLTALHRRKIAVVSRSAITLDVDHAAPALPERMQLTEQYASIVHSTYSSSPDDPRYRIIIPTDRELLPDEYHMAVVTLMQKLGEEQFDHGSAQPERYMFLPAAQESVWYQAWVTDGDPLKVDELLRDFNPDLSSLPMPKPSARKRNPFELEGVAGAFNRAYAIDDVIKEYDLPYEPVGERWQLVGAKAEAGMGLIAEGLVYSHHITDPAEGQTCSAFDLVRLHRFGELDEAISRQTPVNRRPSHQAMLELASSDARVIGELVGVDFTAGADELAANDWKLDLKLVPKTGRFLDVIENWDLVRKHEPVFQSLQYNEMSTSVEMSADPPWRELSKGGPTMTGTDRAALCHYIERQYHIRPARSLIDELVDVTAQQTYVNPVKDYLLSLKWDGVPRLEECLPGVRPTPYTRMVARKSLVAAVARIMEPGIKWDHAMVLYGTEGLGKSYWIEKMSRGYSSTLGRIGDKDTLITMQRSWIMVSDEGYSLRKADSDVQKEFLTRTEDVFRLPYEREALVHKRHCVIWGTTNDEVFLRRQEGNRRFLIVRCEDYVDFDLLTDEYVGQVWAEAVFLYQAGERLYLADGETAVAAKEREEFTEEDALAGVLYAYLETLVPDDWDSMSIDSRRVWMQNRADNMVPEGTRHMTETCSAQMWVEAMGRRFGDHRRTDLLEITAALKHMPGWEIVQGRHRVPNYGPQVVFRRLPTEDLI